WSLCIRSLYQLTKVRQNAYFYVCSHSFTVLFRAAGVGAMDEINALVYPTTAGLRKSLVDEDIQFTMPLADDTQSAVESEESCATQINDIVDDEESTVFLESLGLSQQDFPSLKQNKVKTKSDSKKTSLIALRGPDTLLFLTFLTTNSQYVISKTGPSAGIPPTLLSPVAFHGASLLPLKLKEKEIKHKEETIYSLEINGPILPNTVHGLCEFMRETQEGNFSASLSTQESTIPFATVNGSISRCQDNILSVFATENLKDSGFGNTEFLRDICVQSQHSNKSISNVVVNDNVYTLK
ncbi:protein downstream neighbor of Son-like protein, partial [Leptotrombidium deliense]